MKALLCTGLAAIVMFLLITVLFRTVRVTRRAAAILTLFCLSIPLWLAIYICSPSNLWILPSHLVEPSSLIDRGLFLFLYSAVCFGGLLQLYNLADRGLSLRILIDLLETDNKPIAVDDILDRYSNGRGIAWMYEKRIDGITATGLAVVQNGKLHITDRGRVIAGLYSTLRQFLKLPRQDKDQS